MSKTEKEETLNDASYYMKYVESVFSEKKAKAFYAQCKAIADKYVERHKKQRTGVELEDFREECIRQILMKNISKQIKKNANYGWSDWEYWADKGVTLVTVAAGTVAGLATLGAITRSRDGSPAADTGSPFQASPMPSRRGKSVEAVV